MTAIVLMKAPNGALVPADPQATEYIASLKLGAAVRAEVKRMRNYKFHKKLFALLQFAFDTWEPTDATYKGQIVEKNFDQFRNDVTVLAGFFETTITLKGEVRVVAKSISFGSMSQDDFDKLYSAVCNVVLAKILKNYDREQLDAVMDQLTGFL
jgi:hypothetical protein